jgi:hypothetical protein
LFVAVGTGQAIVLTSEARNAAAGFFGYFFFLLKKSDTRGSD